MTTTGSLVLVVPILAADPILVVVAAYRLAVVPNLVVVVASHPAAVPSLAVGACLRLT